MTRIVLGIALAALALFSAPVAAQAVVQESQEEPQTRQEILQRQREEKRGELEPYVVSTAEERVAFLETWRLPFRLFSKGVGVFSPDSRSLAFGLNGSLMRVDLAALDPRATTSSGQEHY